ncbi:MAG: YigZ family protein [Bacteroidales bacterium]|nr:YigZ family protein [Bacteroidales bacterium]
MELDDTYKTLQEVSEAIYTEKRSKFLAFAMPVETVEEVKELVAQYAKKYYDARHVCYAYMLGHERKEFRANDNGEPSGTAGRPILGAINSHELTNVLIVVIRYFGGIKLGTGGLVVAYKEAAQAAIESGVIMEKLVEEDVRVVFEYPYLNQIMRIVKEENPTVVSQTFDNDCEMVLRIRKSEMEKLRNRLLKVDSARIPEADN